MFMRQRGRTHFPALSTSRARRAQELGGCA
jgi:hypothetical protein